MLLFEKWLLFISPLKVLVSFPEEFELDPTTGDFYVIAPLDREKRSLHFIVLNITEVKDERAVEGNTERSRRSKESEMKNLGTGVNPIVECKMTENS